MKTAYLALEAKRALRNPRALIFTIVFPVVLFLVYKGLSGSGGTPVHGQQANTTAFLMVNMAAFGAFMAALSVSARTAIERAAGWQRQLRLTPLSPYGYLAAKAGVAMIVALPSVALVSLVGFASGVHLSGGSWVQIVLGVWVASLPFALLGLLVGQLASAESLQVYTSGIMLLFSLLGGIWIPINLFPNWLGNVAKVLPSYWMADVGHDALVPSNNVGTAVIALGIWAVVLAIVVVRRYQRDSARV
jgi:ABC-2 type transport system permease protein